MRSLILEHGGDLGNPAGEVSMVVVRSGEEVTICSRRFTIPFQVQRGARVTVKNCEFLSSEDVQKHPFFNVIGSSHVTFDSCTFTGAKLVGVSVQDSSYVSFVNCTFSNCANGVLATRGGAATFNRCSFEGIQGIGCYGFDQGCCVIYNTIFRNIKGKAALFISKSRGELDNGCVFQSVDGVCVAAAKDSEVSVKNTDASFISREAFAAYDGATIALEHINITDVSGNALVFSNATGYGNNISISGAKCPAIGVTGPRSNPVLNNITVRRGRVFGVVLRQYSRPVLNNITIEEIDGTGFSISEFSAPFIRNTLISKVTGAGISVFNGASVKVENVSYDGCVCDQELFMNGTISTEFPELPTDGTSCLTSFPLVGSESLTQLPPLKVSNKCHCGCTNDDHVCSHCGAHGVEHVGVRCGHRLCEHCAKKANGRCPMCRSNCDQIIRVFEEHECVICVSTRPSVICLPCGHKCVCAECAAALAQSQRAFTCPMCQGKCLDMKTDFS